MIYFIRDESSGLIKIGTTVRMADRFKQLVKQGQGPLALLAVTEGGRRREMELHSRFGLSRVRGEWFKPDPELTAFIEAEGRPWDGRCARGRPVALQMSCTDEWRDWLEELSRHLRMPASAVVDNALVQYAKAQGFDRPAPVR